MTSNPKSKERAENDLIGNILHDGIFIQLQP